MTDKMTDKIECPECLNRVTQEELDMFGGWCETCTEGLKTS